jgi:hypothetical protein
LEIFEENSVSDSVSADLAKIDEIFKKVEKKHDIEIIYAVDVGGKQHGIELRDTNFDIGFFYMRNNDSKSRVPIEGVSDDIRYQWRGYDITHGLIEHSRSMSPIHIGMFFPNVVYRADRHYAFITQMRQLLLSRPRGSQLVSNLKSELVNAFGMIKGEMAYVKDYVEAIRKV